MKIIRLIYKFRSSFSNLYSIFIEFLSGKISFKYALYRISSQMTFVGKRYIDGVNWKKYNKHYSEELKIIERVHTTVLEESNILLDQGKINFIDQSRLPLHPNAQLLYETIIQLNPGSILEVGCGGGDHLANLNILNPKFNLHGADLSGAQLEFVKKRHPNKDFSLSVVDVSKKGITLPKVDLIFTQAVLMHITEKNSRFNNAIENLLNSTATNLIVMENWTQHNFFESVVNITQNNKSWSMYYNCLDKDPQTRILIISREAQPKFKPLIDYSQLLMGNRLAIH
jgi:trans-aconitate methyltransferase